MENSFLSYTLNRNTSNRSMLFKGLHMNEIATQQNYQNRVKAFRHCTVLDITTTDYPMLTIKSNHRTGYTTLYCILCSARRAGVNVS